MEGWFSINRQIEHWEWYSDTITFRVFFQLLLQANHAPKEHRGILIGRGQSLTSYKQIIDKIGDKNFTIQQARTAINHLKSTGEITTQSTGGGLLVTIVKYDKFQDNNSKSTAQSTGKQTGNQQAINREANSQLTANNNDNNINNINNIFNYFIKKYKQEKPQNFSDWMRIRHEMREDPKWDELTSEEQIKLFS